MSVPIAVTGEIPKTRISIGVIRDAPPIPVMPTSIPMPSPKKMIAGSMTKTRGRFRIFLTELVRSRAGAKG